MALSKGETQHGNVPVYDHVEWDEIRNSPMSLLASQSHAHVANFNKSKNCGPDGRTYIRSLYSTRLWTKVRLYF